MAKPNYAFAKRQRELAKKERKEEKRKKKTEPDESPPPATISDAFTNKDPA